MPSFDVAHLREQGQNMLLFPLSSNFGNKTDADQRSVLGELEMRAHAAGLAGTAAVFWESGGRTRSLGPTRWQGFLRSMSLSRVLASVNRTISW